jgi:hypothetical protein
LTVVARCLAVLVIPLAAAGCGGGGSGPTVPASDASPPTLTLQAGQQGGGGTSVTAGGSGATLTLTAKTGPLNLSAAGNDPESGMQTVQIFVNTKVTRCHGTACSGSGQTLSAIPRFQSSGPARLPGETFSASSILADAIDLAQEIPQTPPPPGDKIIVEFEVQAKAVNNLGGRTQTPLLHARFEQTG